jgi:hypothetical protein
MGGTLRNSSAKISSRAQGEEVRQASCIFRLNEFGLRSPSGCAPLPRPGEAQSKCEFWESWCSEPRRFIKRDLGEVRNDTKDVRERLTRLEERVALPSKGFIVLVVTTGLVISVGLATAITGLQNFLSSPKPPAKSP